MIDRIESVEQDLRQWGQRQMAVLDSDSIGQLRVLCDRIWSIRVDERKNRADCIRKVAK